MSTTKPVNGRITVPTDDAPAPIDIVSVIRGAGQPELDQVIGRIGELANELDALRHVRKILEAKLGIEKPPPKPVAKPGPKVEARPSVTREGGVMQSHRVRAAEYLLRTGIAVRPMIVAADCNIPNGSLIDVLGHEWFVKEPNGYRLSPEGRKAVGSS